MEPKIQNNSLGQSNNAVPQEMLPSSSASEKTKSPKATIWCLSIIAIIAIIVAVSFACLYFLGTGNQPQPQPQNTTPPTTTEPTAEEEVEITDAVILDHLDETLSILFNKSGSWTTLNTGPSINTEDMHLIKDGYLDKDTMVGHVVQSISSESLSEEEIQAAISQSKLEGEDATFFRSDMAVGINGEKVRSKYKQIFGEDLEKGATAAKYCENYQYLEQFDVYYSDAMGCGGATSESRFYYKNKYTTDGNHAYVYISTALHNRENGNIYCDIVDYMNNYTEAKICAKIDPNTTSFTLDADNYQDYSKYRFVFNKASDGTYYFEKIEKL